MTSLVKKLFLCGAKKFTVDLELPEERIWVSVGTAGREQRKFELEANFLNHQFFEDLLRLSVDEFGYNYSGVLRIGCEIDFFLHVVDLLKDSNPAVHYMELQDLIDGFYSNAGRRTLRGCHHHHYHKHKQHQQF